MSTRTNTIYIYIIFMYRVNHMLLYYKNVQKRSLGSRNPVTLGHCSPHFKNTLAEVIMEAPFRKHPFCCCHSLTRFVLLWNQHQCNDNTDMHYDDVIMGAKASLITSLTIVYSAVYSYQRKHQSFTSLAFVRGIHWGSVNSPHKWFDEVIMDNSEPLD